MLKVDDISGIIERFNVKGKVKSVAELESGHINSTYRVSLERDGVLSLYTLQAINKFVFKNPPEVMANIVAVTSHIREKLSQSGGDVKRGVLTVVPTNDGKYFYADQQGEYWRLYNYIDGAHTFDTVDNPVQLYNAGYGFGMFQKMLEDFPMERLIETIPHFHDTQMRFEQLLEAAQADIMGRAAKVLKELDFFRKRADEMSLLVKLTQSGDLPLRVVHNDTKFNNILIDDTTNAALSVIDLDTVMPGITACDFGDAIRYATNTAPEDETDLTKVGIDMHRYESFTKGFLEAIGKSLSDKELSTLPWGAKLISMELAMRFLTDHINGDKYFKIHRENHNLDRARCQLTLAKSMEENFDQMFQIVTKFA